MSRSATTNNGLQNILLLGYDSHPAMVGSVQFNFFPAPRPTRELHTSASYDAIIVSPTLLPSHIASTRARAPDATIIAHLRDNADQQEIIDRIQQGADDVIFDSQMAASHLLSNHLLIARERRQHGSNGHRKPVADLLTGLSDRKEFLQQLQRMLKRPRQARIALMIFDIHAFKSINDSLGHEVGDELLRTVGERLQSLAEDGAFCARIGHDHFAIALENTEDVVTAGVYAETVVALVRKPYQLQSTSQAIYITVSLGLTIEDDGECDADNMVRQANIALSQAKDQGRPIARFEPLQAADVHYKHLLRNNLHSALANEEFFLLYQPLIDMKSGRVTGVESLLRWQHPSLGLITPDLFISLLEETGLITEVGFWVIDSVCLQLKQWRDNGKVGADFSAAINISSKQFHDSDLASYIEGALARNGISPQQIKLELTESLLVVDTDLVADKLYRLKALGVSICIDDFGTGYASLSYLRQFPIDVLKIDQSFIHNIGVSEQNEAIVLAIINLAHDLHFRVIAEGVETAEQRAFLTLHGCDTFQGYLFGKPAPASDIRAHNNTPGNSAFIHVA